MSSLTETLHAAGFLVSEANGSRSREKVTIKSSVALLAGSVLGLIGIGASGTYAAPGGNTGNFTCGTVTVAAGVKQGTYRAELINATHFVMQDPSGAVQGEGTFGSAFTTLDLGLSFTVTAGGTPGVVGDTFSIAVAVNADAGKYLLMDPAAADGSQVAAAVLYADADASAGDKVATVIARAAEVNASELVWKAGATTNQKNAAKAQLLANQGIVSR